LLEAAWNNEKEKNKKDEEDDKANNDLQEYRSMQSMLPDFMA
jgi:hypothetical protein